MMMLLFHVTPRVLKLKISLGMRLGAYVHMFPQDWMWVRSRREKRWMWLVRTKGKNESGAWWDCGIERPSPGQV